MFKNSMHKSVVSTFGLLLSSLVMLAVTPFLNNNSFSNVMAQEYDKYGDSSYSQYPTGDKKYECRTGPFEGFFVGSVEFCKHVKFDDNDRKDHSRDNKTAIHGPPGINGTNGVNGRQGPPGITFINNTNLYEVHGPVRVAVSNIIETTSAAVCDQGDIVIEGGYRSNQGGSNVIVDGPSTANGILDGSYIVTMVGGGKAFVAVAFCFDNPPLRP